jgi:hypothetical protein
MAGDCVIPRISEMSDIEVVQELTEYYIKHADDLASFKVSTEHDLETTFSLTPRKLLELYRAFDKSKSS